MNTTTDHPEPAHRPDQDTDPAPVIEVSPRQLTDLAELLEELDDFLRMGPGSIDALTEYYRTRQEDHHPRFTALCLLDSVSFTALCLRRAAAAGRHQEPGQ